MLGVKLVDLDCVYCPSSYLKNRIVQGGKTGKNQGAIGVESDELPVTSQFFFKQICIGIHILSCDNQFYLQWYLCVDYVKLCYNKMTFDVLKSSVIIEMALDMNIPNTRYPLKMSA